MECQHCGKDKPDVKSRHYDGPGRAYRGAQPLPDSSAYFKTRDDCHEAAARYDSNMSRWLHEQFEKLS
jgi:hypothetical protein